MRRTACLGSLVLLGVALALSGCGDGGGGDELVWTGTGIHGYVTAGRGDYAVANAEVDLYAVTTDDNTYQPAGGLAPTLTKTTYTTGSGYYRFEGLTSGYYLVKVPSTSTRAGARFQYLQIDTEGQQLRADLIATRNFVAQTPTELPWVVSVTTTGGLLTPGAVLTGSVSLTVTAASSDQATLPVKLVIVKVGHLSNGSNYTLDNGDTQLTYTLDSTRLGDGPTFVYVTVYDLNNNAASVSIPVTVANGGSGALPPAPATVRVEAWTFAEPYGIKAVTRQFNLPPIQVRINGTPVYLPQVSSLNIGTRAISGTGTVMVHIQIKPDDRVTSDRATSYRIYRRTGTSGAYQLIGERVNDSAWYEDAYTGGVRWDALWFNDLDPALKIKQDYYYRVAAVNAAGEMDSGHEYHVMILPKFTANLIGPANGASVSLGVTPNPVFTWSASGGLGLTDNMGFLIYVLNKNDEDPTINTIPFSWLHIVNGTTNATYGDLYESAEYFDDYDLNLPGVPAKPLVPNAIYEWDLLLAYSAVMYQGMDFDDAGYAVSYSFPRVDQGSSNGSFTFTTAP